MGVGAHVGMCQHVGRLCHNPQYLSTHCDLHGSSSQSLLSAGAVEVALNNPLPPPPHPPACVKVLQQFVHSLLGGSNVLLR
jgi:hypothetical protein